MKIAIITLLSAAIAVAAESHNNHHAHQHLHEKRDPSPAADVVVPGPTVVVYELNGHFISEKEVDQGINNGTLVYASDGKLSSAAQSTVPSTSAVALPTSTYVAPTTTSTPTTSSEPTTSSTSAASPTSSTSTPSSASSVLAPTFKMNNNVVQTSQAAPSPSPQSAPATSGGNGVGSDFPDGTLDCSHFPSDFGAVSIDWLGLGGWTGVQTPESFSGGYGDILTQTSGTCSGNNCCSEGSFCSYACPAGYQKSQWPSTQGSTGQSVGGIQCKGGKLHLTNPSLSSKLCVGGAAQVSVEVVNNLSKNVAVCRTDYPGTESMTIPIDAQPGTTNPVTCPDSASYYHWLGGSTSAQYYVNPAGVSLSDGCTWGTAANPWGNFAPMNIGVGYSNGAAWLSIFQNAPTTDAKLAFNVEIKGDSLSGSCKYSNGQYCGSTGCSATGGCTVSLSSGTAQFVFS